MSDAQTRELNRVRLEPSRPKEDRDSDLESEPTDVEDEEEQEYIVGASQPSRVTHLPILPLRRWWNAAVSTRYNAVDLGQRASRAQSTPPPLVVTRG